MHAGIASNTSSSARTASKPRSKAALRRRSSKRWRALALAAVAAELRDIGSPKVVVAAADMADSDALSDIVECHRRHHHDMSALILSASVGTAGPVASYPLHRLDKTLAVNFRVPFQLIQAALPILRAAAERHRRLGSRMILLASTTGVYPETGLAAYGASKAAAVSLAESSQRGGIGHRCPGDRIGARLR